VKLDKTRWWWVWVQWEGKPIRRVVRGSYWKACLEFAREMKSNPKCERAIVLFKGKRPEPKEKRLAHLVL
jgi:hypothetical protein